ncbi:hypothetical protein ABZ543_07125 [Streptomyces roseifaciens]
MLGLAKDSGPRETSDQKGLFHWLARKGQAATFWTKKQWHGVARRCRAVRSTTPPRVNRVGNLACFGVLLLFVIIPLYVLAVIVAWRSGLFDFTAGTLKGADTAPLWTCIGSGIAATAALVGVLVTANSNRQSERRLGLDTAVKGIALTHLSNGDYAPRPAVAGALASLVHLYHPVIAMRVLAAAWDAEAVDTGSAVWLINEALVDRKPRSQVEAARLFHQHANRLCSKTRGQYELPALLEEMAYTPTHRSPLFTPHRSDQDPDIQATALVGQWPPLGLPTPRISSSKRRGRKHPNPSLRCAHNHPGLRQR